ncbi:MAG TPA: glycine cleavage system protein GcvH [Burkholderiaceae bacterium]|nr:glycine cleavage system protein GcvH [Burkholderiaceae bacterium]HYA77019.1 glycine cleavage system protein GcvH [Burkholderiaceae bacterium]
MNNPPELRYTESHEWVRTQADGSVLVGITDFAQDALGDLVFIDLPPAGKSFTAGQVIAVVESVKAASDIYAPVNGTVTAVNDTVKDAPEKVNRDAFGAWLFQMQPQDIGDVGRLLDAAAYQAQLDSEK